MDARGTDFFAARKVRFVRLVVPAKNRFGAEAGLGAALFGYAPENI